MTTSVPALRSPGLRELRTDGDRLLSMVDRLALVGAQPDGGISRLGITELENRARSVVAGWARRAGLDARLDTASNLVVRRRGRSDGRPTLLLGSHLDTVVRGGALDGAFGVLAALEVLHVLRGVDLPFEPAVIAFANEEGGYFPCPFFGSMAVAGALGPTDGLQAVDGLGIREGLAIAGGDLDRVDEARWSADALCGYLELHIEQGPVLENAGIPLGIVSVVTGRLIFTIEVAGQRNHAGTTPMDDRHDALAAAAEITLGVESLAGTDAECTVATIGVLEVDDSATNVVPGHVHMTAEFRDGDPVRLQLAERHLEALLADVADRRDVAILSRATLRCAPAPCDPQLVDRIATGARRLGREAMVMPSGAGHDAQIMAGITRAGMIFVPSRDGVSHAPAEHTDPALLRTGVECLLQAVLAVADDPV